MRSRAFRRSLCCRLLKPRFPAIGVSTTHSSGGAAWPRISRGLLPSQGTLLYFPVLFAFLICPLYYIRAYLAIPATWAPVERLFSVAGNVISGKRTRLSDGAAADLIVLHQSWATCAAAAWLQAVPPARRRANPRQKARAPVAATWRLVPLPRFFSS